VQSFSASYHQLIDCIANKLDALAAGSMPAA
jgi:hypothetical protein